MSNCYKFVDIKLIIYLLITINHFFVYFSVSNMKKYQQINLKNVINDMNYSKLSISIYLYLYLR
jgi:hypothetical protein